MALIGKEDPANEVFVRIAAICHIFVNSTLTFCYLSYTLGWTFIAVLVFVTTLFLLSQRTEGKFRNISYERERLTDIKNNLMSEVLNNIKMLKIYGWQDEFKNRIQQARDNEMVKYVEELRGRVIINSVGMFFSQVIPAIAFALYIGYGNELDLPMALTVFAYFDRLKWAITEFPTNLRICYEI